MLVKKWIKKQQQQNERNAWKMEVKRRKIKWTARTEWMLEWICKIIELADYNDFKSMVENFRIRVGGGKVCSTCKIR